MDGVVVIDKPSGPTSFDVVREVRERLGVKKAGHTGTLDPMATGVLPVCVGEATKIAGFITEGDKAYDAVIALGVETDTQDGQGKPVREQPVPELGRERLEAELARFRGPLLQTPPMYSAVKIGGKRLYELARAGEEVPREPRPVTVHALELKELSARELTVSVRCSKGFFVRTLAFDLGRALGCGAHLKALRRTRSGPFELAQAIPLDRLDPAQVRLVSLADALSELPVLVAQGADAERVRHGVPLEVGEQKGRLRVMDSTGQLLAVAEVGASSRLKYLRVVAKGME